jgi:hypothetical protein
LAAEAAAEAAESLQVSNTARLRDLAQSAARVFGWDAEKQQRGDTYQTIVISQEQQEQIRQLRGATVHEAPQPEGPPHADAHRDNGKSFVTRADEKLTALVGT